MQFKEYRFLPEDFEEYLDELDERYEISVASSTLRRKSEYYIDASEAVFVKCACAELRRHTWKEFNLKLQRVRFYVQALGGAFPAYGKEGFKRLEEYCKQNGMEYDQRKLQVESVLLSMYSSEIIIIEGLRDILEKLFDIETDSGVAEIEFAKMIWEMNEICKLYIFSKGYDYYKNTLLPCFTDKIAELIRKVGIGEGRKIMTAYRKGIAVNLPEMTEAQKANYYKEIDAWKKAFEHDEQVNDAILQKFIVNQDNFDLDK